MAASVAAVVTLIASSVVYALVGGVAAAAYAAPVLLLVVAALEARLSSHVTRREFATRDEWRDAERSAVAAALLLRRRTA